MENHGGLRQKISRLLRSSSCGSCKSRTTSDVIARSETLPRSRHKYQLIDLFSPNPHPFPSIFRPKTAVSPLPKAPFPSPLLTPHKTDGPKCPPVSPISPLFAFPKRKKSKKKRNKPTQLLKRANSDNYYSDSDDLDDDENMTLFSSVPLSSDSSFGRNRANSGVNGHMRRRECELGLAPSHGTVRGSFVVKKRSSNPYDDFRNSMVEMILARQIFGATELENLLETFLSLNSYHHHGVIVQVFTEIWNALFCQNSLK